MSVLATCNIHISAVSAYSEIAPKLWWDGFSEYARTEALKVVGAKDDEAGRLAAWNHHREEVEAEPSRHPSVGMTIPKK